MNSNHGGPTPAEKIRALMTTLVELPELSKRAGEPIRVLIRVLAADEFLEAVRDIPTFAMGRDEARAYLDALDPEGKAELNRRSIEADHRLIALAVLSPRVVLEDTGVGVIPVTALTNDRIFLIQKIMEFSGLLATPPSGAQSPKSDVSDSAVSDIGLRTLDVGPPKEVNEESFRGAVGDPAGHGDPLEPARVRDPESAAG